MIPINPPDIKKVLTEQLLPTAVMWNRLEGRPRTHQFDKALKAEVRDALWMLTRQWQMGEFKADDAGSPVSAKVHIQTSGIHKYKASGNEFESINATVPLETRAEQMKIPFERNQSKISIDIRLQMGQYWLRLLRAERVNLQGEYTTLYKFELPLKSRDSDSVHAHKDEWQKYAAISGRCMDGYLLYDEIVRKNNKASSGIGGATVTQTLVLDRLGEIFVKRFGQLFHQPAEEKHSAWLPDRLEYRFECASGSDKNERILTAEEYHNGHLDWYAFNIRNNKQSRSGPAKENHIDSFIPTHVEFSGMPDRRWWKFEDCKTSFGNIKPSTTDLSKLLLIEFGLIYANDWFLLPFTVPIGSLSNIEGLAVTNNFGETHWIESAMRSNSAGQEWSMYKPFSKSYDDTLLLAPTAIKVQEGKPVEEVLMVRDEISNMVWGIEKIVPSSMGHGANGGEYALQRRKYHEDLVNSGTAPVQLPYKAKISYLAMTGVPENWIPFIPVHLDVHKRQTQLQRASMLRIIDNDPDPKPKKIKPMTGILREGLESNTPYYLHEEEVPRAGVRIKRSFQRTRWTNGEIHVWLGMKKSIGKGEGSSGLAFDQIVDVKS